MDTDNLPWAEELEECLMQTKKNSLHLQVRHGSELKLDFNTLQEKQKAFLDIVFLLKTLNQEERCRLMNLVMTDLGGRDKKNLKIMSWQDVEAMSSNGITFGAHTLTHPVLTRLSLAQAEQEINGSKLMIEGRIKKAVKHFVVE